MNADRIVGTVSERHAQLDAAQNTKESAQHSLQQLKAEIRAILDYLDMCSYSNFTAEKYDITKRRLRELSAV
jgi:hypothetical protein